VFAVIRDQGANVVAATHKLGNICEWDLNCFAHGLNRCVVTTIEDTPAVDGLLKIVKKVVRHFRKSPKSWKLLVDDYVLQNNKPPLQPVNSSKTRWFSTYQMLKWFLEVNDSLDEVIPRIKSLDDINFTRNEIKLLDDVHDILRPLSDATALVEADKFPTLAWGVEIHFLLLKHTSSFNARVPAGKCFCQTLNKSLKDCFSSMSNLVYMAALLTPHLRDSPALVGHKDDAWKLLKA